MNQNETRTLWISVGAALVAVLLLYSYTQEKSAELTKKFGAQSTVVVAKTEIQEMETIDETMLDTKSMPTEFIQPEAIINIEDAVGKVALAPIIEGEQVMITKVQEPSSYTGLSLQVSPTRRALTVPIDEMRGVAKLIKPGDRVDLIASLVVGNGPNKQREIRTLLQDIVILATGERIMNQLPRKRTTRGNKTGVENLKLDTSFTNVTIEVDPKQAQDLIYILSTSPGSLFLTLRHPSDHVRTNLSTSDVDSVLGKPKKEVIQQQIRRPAAAPPKPKPKPKRRSGPFIDI